MKDIHNFADLLGYTRAVLRLEEDFIKGRSFASDGNPSASLVEWSAIERCRCD